MHFDGGDAIHIITGGMSISETGQDKAAGRIKWKPTITEIARVAGVGTATVDRIVNGRSGVREPTRQRVLEALAKLTAPVKEAGGTESQHHRVAFLSDSGGSFNATLEAAVWERVAKRQDIEASFNAITTAQVDPIKFANLIERTAESSDALIVVVREDLTVSRAIRNVISRGVPVICLTTDLPTSGRTAYVGSDQTGAGATAAYLMGKLIRNPEGNILLVYSAPYRAQEERELGFRRVLRSEFPMLRVHERVNSNDDTDYVYRNVVRYIEDHGAPAGIYNVAGGNIGIGKALKEFGLDGGTVFIGHELNANSRLLLETGVMSFAIGHDVAHEIEIALDCIKKVMSRQMLEPPPLTCVRIYTKYSCN